MEMFIWGILLRLTEYVVVITGRNSKNQVLVKII